VSDRPASSFGVTMMYSDPLRIVSVSWPLPLWYVRTSRRNAGIDTSQSQCFSHCRRA
jgi:hypothetical protein